MGYTNAQLVHAISVINTTQTGAQGFVGKDFGDLSDLSSIPIVGGMIASHSKITTILHNEQVSSFLGASSVIKGKHSYYNHVVGLLIRMVLLPRQAIQLWDVFEMA